MTRSVLSGSSVILRGLPAVSAHMNLKMFAFVLRRKFGSYIARSSLLKVSALAFDEALASLSNPFSIISAYLRVKVE